MDDWSMVIGSFHTSSGHESWLSRGAPRPRRRRCGKQR